MTRRTIATLTVWGAYLLGALVASFLSVFDFGTLPYWLVFLGGSVGFATMLNLANKRGVDE